MIDEDRLSERAAIDAEIEGMTLCDVFAHNAATHPNEPALSWKDDGHWARASWAEYRQRVLGVASGLRRLGVTSGDHVALMLGNRPEHVIADLGALHAGAVPLSIYEASSAEQIAHIVDDCGAKVAIVEGLGARARWEAAAPSLPTLQRVVALDDMRWASGERGKVIEASWRAVGPDDPATVVYTSGTTGEPKGAVVTHRNALWTAASTTRALPKVAERERMISHLPMAHALERLVSIYLALWRRAWVHFCPNPRELFELLPEVRPGVFIGVPRVWEKLAGEIATAFAGDPAEIQARVGLDACRIAATGGAAISEETATFFSRIGLPLLDGFGMTETSGLAIMNRPGRARAGTVGWPLPGVDVRLSPDGELLVRGGNVVAGYHGKPEETAAAIDADGWLHTGDLATIDDDGFVRIVDRKKELLVTAGGKNVAPASIERLLGGRRLIGQACVVGERRPYVTALVVLDSERLTAWAQAHEVTYAGIADLARDARVVEEVRRAVDEVNARLSRPEQIKRFTVLPTDWTATTGELTPSLKLKRRVITQRYAAEIDSMYG